jgi:hypothetical protein
MLDRQHLSHGAAGRMAAPMDPVEAQPVDELQGVVGHLRDAVVDARKRTAARSAMIVEDHSEIPGKRRNMIAPEAAVAAEAGHKEQWRAVAVRFVVKFCAVAELEVRHCTLPRFP